MFPMLDISWVRMGVFGYSGEQAIADCFATFFASTYSKYPYIPDFHYPYCNHLALATNSLSSVFVVSKFQIFIKMYTFIKKHSIIVIKFHQQTNFIKIIGNAQNTVAQQHFKL